MTTNRPDETTFDGATQASTRRAPTYMSLVIMSGEGARAIPLSLDSRLVIGRSGHCDVYIDDPSLSRKHVLIEIGRELFVQDMGSLNGTRVDGRVLTAHERVCVRIGDVINAGDTMMVVQARAEPHPRQMRGHGYLEARLEDECVRAREAGQTLALLRVHLLAHEAGLSAESCLQDWLRPRDLVALYAPGEYEALLLDVSDAEARDMAGKLTEALTAARVPHRLGYAIYPIDGRTGDALIAAAGQRALDEPHHVEISTDPLIRPGAINRLRPILERVAQSEINVLILGETGVGKEVLAETIHRLSPRSSHPLLRLNCGGFSESLLESELFGHEKGSFTGAQQAKLGLLETAQGGTVFLDELGEMPLATQVKLLRVIEERQVLRVGAVKTRPIDVRFIAATNRNLEDDATEGRFRSDLYFRLNGIALTLPPLRERIDEIEGLVRVFIARAASRSQIERLPSISSEALAVLRSYRWPGNIRELRNVVERAVVLSGGGVITPEHLPQEKIPGRRTQASHAPRAEAELEATSPVLGAEEDTALNTLDRLQDALTKCAYNQTRAAEMLGVSRRTVVAWMRKLNMPRPRKRDATAVRPLPDRDGG